MTISQTYLKIWIELDMKLDTDICFGSVSGSKQQKTTTAQISQPLPVNKNKTVIRNDFEEKRY